jgi:hypothetical protein
MLVNVEGYIVRQPKLVAVANLKEAEKGIPPRLLPRWDPKITRSLLSKSDLADVR